MYSMGRQPPRGVPYSCPVFGYRYSATLAPIGVKFCMMVQYIFVPDVSSPLLGPIAPHGSPLQGKYVAFFSIYAISSVTNARPLMHGRAACSCITSRQSTQLAACRASADGTSLPAVMDQIFVHNCDFYTPPALLPSLEQEVKVI